MSDYGVDLEHDIDTISWRRFNILLNNLSPDSAYVSVIQSRMAKKDRSHMEAISDPEMAVRSVDNVWR